MSSSEEWSDAGTPQSVGLDPDALAAAVTYATENGTDWPKDLTKRTESPRNHEPPPWNDALGPIDTDRGDPSGLIVRKGTVVARWGDTHHQDMTYSVAKSYYAILAGVAYSRGLIKNLDDEVRSYSLDDGFESKQNQGITWRHLLQQTSEWEGKLFDKPDQLDRNRSVKNNADNSLKGTYRELGRPGEFWEYNDVRVNRLGLSLLQLFREPLPEVLSKSIMEPIGASSTWQWIPYRNSYVMIDGRRMPSVPGGGHWGGGLVIHAEDHARVGQLIAQRGSWNGKQLIDESWFPEMEAPCTLNRNYGFMWWLNTNGVEFPNVPKDSIYAQGAGSHLIWVCRRLELVVVARWIRRGAIDGMLSRVVQSIQPS